MSERCRLCLTSSRSLISIADENLSDLLENLLRLSLLADHDLICADCYKKIESFNDFFKMCQDSEKVLKDEIEAKSLASKSKQHSRRTNTTKRTQKSEEEGVLLKPKRTRAQKLVETRKEEKIEEVSLIKEEPPNESDEEDPPFIIKTLPLTFQCNKCPEKFKTEIALSVHSRQLHTLIERCAHCFATFNTPYELKLHTKVHVNSIVGGMKAKFQELFDEHRVNS